MHKGVYHLALLGALALLGGCADTTVRPVDGRAHSFADICIKAGDQELPPDFDYIVKEGFLRHGIKTHRYKVLPDSCVYVLSYQVAVRKDYPTVTLDDVHFALTKARLWSVMRTGTRPRDFSGASLSISPNGTPRAALSNP